MVGDGAVVEVGVVVLVTETLRKWLRPGPCRETIPLLVGLMDAVKACSAASVADTLRNLALLGDEVLLLCAATTLEHPSHTLIHSLGPILDLVVAELVHKLH